jgi:hypothetical protein
MNDMMKQTLSQPLRSFRLPRYAHLPDVGLYLEQTTQYINRCLAPLGCVEITSSMIRNYVKMGLVSHPVGKQYYADQMAHLIVIAILKHTLSLEHIGALFRMQRLTYTDQVAYHYFCEELENVLYFRFGLKDTVDDVGITSSQEKEMLRSAIIAVSHYSYLNACFEHLSPEKDS